MPNRETESTIGELFIFIPIPVFRYDFLPKIVDLTTTPAGVVVKSTILGKKSYLKTGIGININNSPIVDSVSLFGIINKKSNILDLSNIIIDFIEHNLTKKISNQKLVRYLNQYMLKDFKLNQPIFGKNIIEILSVNEDLSLKIKIDDATKNIFFGELV